MDAMNLFEVVPLSPGAFAWPGQFAMPAVFELPSQFALDDPTRVTPLAWCFLGATFLAYLLTWGARFVSPRIGLLDHPDTARKHHGRPTPLMGGVAVFLSFAVCWLVVHGLNGQSAALASIDHTALGIVFSGALFCGFGLWDDAKPLRARTKFLLQVAACIPFLVFSHHIKSLHVLGVDLYLGHFGVVFTLFWLIACTNAFNLLDGLDALAGSVAVISLLSLALISSLGVSQGFTLVAVLLAGSTVGFLIHNWPPAKIFLGDAGSQTIGFLLGAISIVSASKSTVGFTVVAPLIILIVPILDTSLAIVRRKLTGKSIGEPDRGHIHHRLQERGLSRLQTLLSIVAVCLVTGAIGAIAAVTQNDWLGIGLCGCVMGVVMWARIFGHHEAALVLWHIQSLHTVLRDGHRGMAHRRAIAVTALQNTAADDVVQLASAPIHVAWEQLLEEFERLKGTHLKFQFHNSADSGRTAIEWQRDGRANRGTGKDCEAEWTISYHRALLGDFTVSVFAAGNEADGRAPKIFVVQAACDSFFAELAAQHQRLPKLRQTDAIDATLRQLQGVPSVPFQAAQAISATPSGRAAA